MECVNRVNMEAQAFDIINPLINLLFKSLGSKQPRKGEMVAAQHKRLRFPFREQ